MQHVFIQYVFLILIILALVMVANKLKLAEPIVLVLGGLALSISTAFSDIKIDPDLVFYVLLPPVLYEAAWKVSWKEFWRWRRVITGFAFPIVILTSCVIAFVSVALIPGFTLALGFLLGGIISPPDAVSATTIMRRVNVSKSLLSIVEGESLLNDASSLMVFRFALAAVITGQFRLQDAALSIVTVVALGVLTGLAIAVVVYAVNRWLPTTPGIEIALTFATPYCMYHAAEAFHASGVLAVVSGGLFLSNRRQSMLNYRTRIEAVNVWDSVIFLVNGLIFLLIGLQLPTIAGQLGDVSLGRAVWLGLAISAVLMVTRLACTLGASVLTTFMSRFITVADPYPGWRNPVVLGWAGMRGVISLAMALSIPLLADQDRVFPFRNLILFITFVVILVTLVFQGLTLPWVIRMVKPEDKYTAIPEHEQDLIIQRRVAEESIAFLNQNFGSGSADNEHVENLISKLETDIKTLAEELERPAESAGDEDSQEPGDADVSPAGIISLALLEHQRSVLEGINRESEFDEDLVRRHLALIDMEELKVRERRLKPEQS